MIDGYRNMNIHFIGIGGAGMIPLAIHTQKLGNRVTGSDNIDENFAQLKRAGINPTKGHGTVPAGTDLVIYSAAVTVENPELSNALASGIPVMKRAEFLGEVTKEMHSILVSGSHGKSTTSVMLADMLNGHEPFNSPAIIGGEAVRPGSNYYEGSGDHIILEADEYDRSFLKLYPDDLIILNIDNDHMDVYGDMNGLKSCFSELAGKLSKNSFLIFNSDDGNTVSVSEKAPGRKIPFGINNRTGYNARDIEFSGKGTKFRLYLKEEFISDIEFCYFGMHNVYNMLAALSLVCSYGVGKEMLNELAGRFMGIKRRMELVHSDKDHILIDDYAHHPTEIKNILSAAKKSHSGRIIAMFQPHLYSRTKYHAEDFAKSFGDADLVLISQIYPAREKKDPSVTSSMILDSMTKNEAEKTEVFGNFDDLFARLTEIAEPGDMIIAIGAGEINKVLYEFRDMITGKK